MSEKWNIREEKKIKKKKISLGKNLFAMNLVTDSKQKSGIQVFVIHKVVNKSDTDGTVLYLKAFFFLQKMFCTGQGVLCWKKISKRVHLWKKFENHWPRAKTSFYKLKSFSLITARMLCSENK